MYAGVWALTKAARRTRAERDLKEGIVGEYVRAMKEGCWKGM